MTDTDTLHRCPDCSALLASWQAHPHCDPPKVPRSTVTVMQAPKRLPRPIVRCPECGESSPDAFYPSSRKSGYLCKRCLVAYNQRQRAAKQANRPPVPASLSDGFARRLGARCPECGCIVQLTGWAIYPSEPGQRHVLTGACEHSWAVTYVGPC